MTDSEYVNSIADVYATSGIPALVEHRARLLKIAARLAAAEQMAQALDAMIGLAVMQSPDSWHAIVNAARSARAAWEAAK
jgi:hypothetical protein